VDILASHPVFLHIGDVTVRTHGLFFALGGEIAYLNAVWLAHRRGLSDRWIGWVTLLTFISGLGGARLGFVMAYPSSFHSLSEMLGIWHGGLLSFGGIIAGLTVFYVSVRRLDQDNWPVWRDIAVVAGLVGWAVGRLGNYYAGDSVGMVSAAWNVFYGRIPIQLFESVVCLGIAVWASRRISASTYRPGTVAYPALCAYFGGRFIIDIWRQDTMVFPGVNASQLASLVFLAIILVVWKRERHAA
jgi:prolipoprotein diacylglyceryltransferase